MNEVTFENVFHSWINGNIFEEQTEILEEKRTIIPPHVEEDYKRPVKCFYLDEDANVLEIEPETVFNVHSYWESHLISLNWALFFITLFILLILLRFLIG